MKLDFSHIKLTNRAFSEAPMTFMDRAPKESLSNIVDIIALESGNPTATEYWQKVQIRNLITHAHSQSAFWRKRIGSKAVKSVRLSDLPIMTRQDLSTQVAAEGALIGRAAGLDPFKHSTSGSSGRPVQFYLTNMNAYYNSARTLAQYFMEGRDLSLNRVRLNPLNASQVPAETLRGGIAVSPENGWLGPLAAVFKNGKSKTIKYWRPQKEFLARELSQEPIGYLAGQPRLIESMFKENLEFFQKNKMAMMIPISETMDDDLRAKLETLNIPVRGSYSCEEIGMIGAECTQCPNHYHVASSNVVVETNAADSFIHKGVRISQILLTHLHSYATPFIRYDCGDYGVLSEGCPCGHRGQTISHIYGRAKNLLRHADGRLTVFHIRARDFTDAATFDEYRMRQTGLDKLVVEIARATDLGPHEIAAVRDLIAQHADDDAMQIDIKRVDAIDWGASAKKLGFYSEVV